LLFVAFVIIIILNGLPGDWDAKVGSQEIPELTGKFHLGVQNEQGKG